MRVLMVSLELPNMDAPVTSRAARLGPLQRQIRSLRHSGIEVDFLPVTGARRVKYLQAITRLQNVVARVDLVHAHYGFCGWVARSQIRKPVVVSFMGSDVLRHRGNARDLGAKAEVCSNIILSHVADAVIVKSEEMGRVLGMPAYVIPNGVDLGEFAPHERTLARAKLGWSTDTPRLLFPGNPGDPTKGFRMAEAVVRRAEALCGRTIALVALWGVPPQEVPLYMNASDAVLMTSITEGSPNVIKEAMACNVPIVSVMVGDVQHLLSGVANCCVVTRETEALAHAVKHLVESPGRSNGRDRLLQLRLDLASVAEQIRAVYQVALERHSRQFGRSWMRKRVKEWAQ